MERALDIGKLNKKITFVKYQTTGVDELGQDRLGWADYKTVHAHFRPIRGLETDEAARKFREKRTYKAICRWIPDIDASCRIRYKDRVFEIRSVIDVNEAHYKLEIECEEYVDRDIDAEESGDD